MAAGNATIGALRVILGADTADLDKGLKSSQTSIAAFGKSAGAAFAAVAVAAAAAAVAIGAAMQNTIDDMDKLSKSSAKLGIPIEQLSALQYAASLADVSFETLSKSVAKLSRTMVDAAAKPTGEAAKAFQALGVSVKDSEGRLRSSDDVLAEVADKFSGLRDGAGKTAAAIAIFGRAGAELIPLLNDGSAGLKNMKEEAEQFGLIIDGKTGKAAEAFNDNLTRLRAAWQGIVAQATAQVLPSMVAITDAMVDTAKNSGILATALNVVTTAIKTLVSAGVIAGAVFQSLAQYISTVSAAISQVASGQFAAAFETLKGGVASIGETATNSFGVVQRLWKGSADGAESSAVSTDKASKSLKEFNFAALGAKSAVDQFIESQTKGLASQQAEIATFGQLAGAKESLRLQLQAEAIAMQNNTVITAAQQAQLDILKQKTSDYALTLTGLQTTQANLAPAQLLQQEQAKINALFDAGKISAETYGSAMQKAAEQAGASWDIAGAQMAGGFADLANAFSKSNKEMAVAGKAFGIVQATINTYTAFTKALASAPPPFNYVLAAGVLAAGMAKVVAISSQSTSGMQTGGALTVRGTGGPDSVPVNFMASPGEQIDVWRPEQGGGPDPRRGAGGGNVVNLSMPIATTRDALRSLIEGLNDMFKDGYKLNVVPA
jgi:TP901 family phage tail tape measure protein